MRNGRRGLVSLSISSLCSQIPGIVRRAVLFSNEMRAGPGWTVSVPLCACASAKTIDRLRRSFVSSPETLRKSEEWVTGSKTIAKPVGRVNDIAAFSPGPSSITSSVTRSMAASTSSGVLLEELQKICRMYSAKGSESGSCAAIRRILGFTVKVTSTSWSSVGS